MKENIEDLKVNIDKISQPYKDKNGRLKRKVNGIEIGRRLRTVDKWSIEISLDNLYLFYRIR